MRRLFLFITFCVLVGSLKSAPIDQQQAIERAKSFLGSGGSNRRGMPRSNSSLRLATTRHYLSGIKEKAPCFYAYNVGDADGFVIVSGDDRMPPILGYAESGSFDEARMPQNMLRWLDGYVLQMEWLNLHPEASVARKVVKGESISPLLTTEWGQGSPYNNECPMDGDYRSVTGCVATAMAQVMNYHRWPAQTTKEIPGYTTYSRKFAIPAIQAGTPISWSQMRDTYSSSSSETEKAAVAQLMKMCGTSLEMNYTSGGSAAATSDVMNALISYFDYSPNISYERPNYYSHSEWNQKVYGELAAGRPVIYGGDSSGGGHAFVIDGYSRDDFFHVNWGWDGYSNNYFLLSILDSDASGGTGADSSVEGYGFNQEALFGVQPNTVSVTPQTVVMTTSSISLPSGTYFTRTSSSADFTFEISSNGYNYMSETYTFDCGAYGLFDQDDKLISVGGNYSERTFEGGGWGYSSMTREVSMGAGITSGQYKIRPLSRQAGTETWYVNHSALSCFITAVISNNEIWLSEPVESLSGTITATGKTETNLRLPLEIAITNDGTFFCGNVFLLEDGELKGGRFIEIDEGATVTLPFSYRPTSSGTKQLSLCLSTRDGFVPFATGSVVISDPPATNMSISMSVSNAVGGYVKEDRALISATVKNNGTTIYDYDVVVELWKAVGNGYISYVESARKPVNVAPGGETTVQLEFNNLSDGTSYSFYTYYYSEGKLTGESYGGRITVKLEEAPEQGDVNRDGHIDVADLSGIVRFILNDADETLAFEAADMDGSGMVEVNDFSALVNVILAPNAGDVKALRSPALLEQLVSLTTNGEGELLVNLLASRNYTGMQFDLSLPEGARLSEDDLEAMSAQHGCWSVHRQDGSYRIVCASASNAELHQGTVLRLHVDGHAEGMANIDHVILSDREAVSHFSAPFTIGIGRTTDLAKSLETGLSVRSDGQTLVLSAQSDRTVRVYTLSGTIVADIKLTAGQETTLSLPTGIYLLDKRKIVIK